MAKCVWCGRRKKLFETFNKYGFCPECKAQVREDIEDKIADVDRFISLCKGKLIKVSDNELGKLLDNHLSTLDELEELREKVPMFKSSTEHLRRGLLTIKQELRDREQAVKADSVPLPAVCPSSIDPAASADSFLMPSFVDLHSEETTVNSSRMEKLDNKIDADMEGVGTGSQPNDSLPDNVFQGTACIEKPKTLTIPQKIGRYELSYLYRDVFVKGTEHANPDFHALNLCDHVDLVPEPDNEVEDQAVMVMCNGQQLGCIASKKGTLQRMVHQWTKKALPIFSAITAMDENEKGIYIVMGFYRDEQEILDKCETICTNLVKTSKKDEFGDSRRDNIEILSVGDVLDADYDWETETYVVTGHGGIEMGELSKSVSAQLQEEDEDSYPYIVVEDIGLNDDLKYVVKLKIYIKPKVR